MPKPFDASTKTLARQYPVDWLEFGGVVVDGPVTAIDGDASIVSAGRDGMFRIDGPNPFLVDEEHQSSPDPSLPDRLLQYNVTGTAQERLPVESVVILLRPAADGPHLTGELRRATPGGEYLVFKYRVIRVWEIPVEKILAGGIGIVALAPLSKGAEKRLPEVLSEVERRFVEELPAPQAADMIAVTGVLMGLKYPAEVCRTFLRGVRKMKDSVVYQMILEEGKKEGREEGRQEAIDAMRHALLNLGGKRFGSPTKAALRKIGAIRSLERLQELTEKILECESWSELLRNDSAT